MTNVERLQLVRRELLGTLQALDQAAYLAGLGEDIVVPLNNDLSRIARGLFTTELVFDKNDSMAMPEMLLTPIGE